MEAPGWATLFQIDDEWVFRSHDWLVMGEGYPTRDEAVRASWKHHEGVMEHHESSFRGLSDLEAEISLLRKELLIMFCAAYEAQYPNDASPSVIVLAREKWGRDVADDLFPDDAYEDEDEDDEE